MCKLPQQYHFVHDQRILASHRGVEKVEHLTPKIGYLQISSFAPVFLVSEKFASAMNALADTDGLIIDLRNNGGGGGDSSALLISYFVDERTRLNDTWERATGVTRQYWTEDKLDGKRYGGKKPVFILAGPNTKSAADAFAYTMQALERATVIGERTWGGAATRNAGDMPVVLAGGETPGHPPVYSRRSSRNNTAAIILPISLRTASVPTIPGTSNFGTIVAVYTSLVPVAPARGISSQLAR